MNFDEINKKAQRRLLFLILLIVGPTAVSIFIILEMASPIYFIFITPILGLLTALAVPATDRYALKIIKRKVGSISPETETTIVSPLFHPYLRFADFDLRYSFEPRLMIKFRRVDFPPFVAFWDEDAAKWSFDTDIDANKELTNEGDQFRRRILEMLKAVSNEKFKIDSMQSGGEEELVLIATPGELDLYELLARIESMKAFLEK